MAYRGNNTTQTPFLQIVENEESKGGKESG
jgi:hypothetical protein